MNIPAIPTSAASRRIRFALLVLSTALFLAVLLAAGSARGHAGGLGANAFDRDADGCPTPGAAPPTVHDPDCRDGAFDLDDSSPGTRGEDRALSRVFGD